jgi:hypothetical protein
MVSSELDTAAGEEREREGGEDLTHYYNDEVIMQFISDEGLAGGTGI